MKNKVKIKVRRSWGDLIPVERIHSDGKLGKKPKYSKRDRKNWKDTIQD